MDLSAARFAAESLRLVPRKRLSRMLGRLADLQGPSAIVDQAVDAFVRVYGVDLTEAEVPPHGFESFDAFFTRRLREGARPILGDLDVLTCPCDGRLFDAGIIDGSAQFVAKGHAYDVAELLGPGSHPSVFENGAYAIIYLAPPDYHRVHAPVNGTVSSARHVAGTLFPVNSIGTKYVPRVFAKNERIAVIQDADDGLEVATILVGAIGVGRISLAFDDMQSNSGSAGETREFGHSGPVLARGDE
ncbi:MAG: phosphatidylserine decarboxylase, partial [Myxococcales bacterium]|nr:phosphatidylserine decarboxylase [Myxococcales bacterium]